MEKIIPHKNCDKVMADNLKINLQTVKSHVNSPLERKKKTLALKLESFF